MFVKVERTHIRVVSLTIFVALLSLIITACSTSGTATGESVPSGLLAPTQTQMGSSSDQQAATASPNETANSPTSGGSSAGGDSTVQVTEGNYHIDLSTNVVGPGQITFQVTNQGPAEHEFVIFKTDLAEDNLPTQNGDVNENASSLTKVYEHQQVASGTSYTVTQNLDVGHYVIVCNLPGHYQLGMHASLTVTQNPGPTQTAQAQSQANATPTPGTPAASQTTGTPESVSATVNVIEKNFDIFLDQVSVPAGTIEFDLRNEGDSSHEFVIFKTDLPADQLPVQDAQVNENAPSLTKIDEQQEFPPGETRTLTEQLDPGHYVFICNLPDHYQQGMRINFTVTGPGSGTATATPQPAEQSQAAATPEAASTPAPAVQPQAGRSVQVIEGNFAIFLNRDSVPAGDVTFNLTNEGPDQHEFVIFQTGLAGDQLPVQNGQVNEDASSLTKIAEQEQYPAGETRTLTVNLKPGHYVLICNLPDHYQQGMYFDFTVTESGSGAPSAASQSSTTVQVVEENYAILMSRSSVPAGQVQFDLKNEGPDQHEFVIFKTDLAPDNLPVQNGQVNENASSLTKIEEQDQYPSGDTRTLTVNLDPGHYVIICNLVGHYQQGMYYELTVTGPSSGS